MVRYAGFWRRAFASAVDGLLLLAAALIFVSFEGASSSPDRVVLAGAVAMIAPFLYHAVFEASALGGSVGKRLIGLRVVGLNGRGLGFGAALGRNVGKLLSGLLGYVGFAAVGFTSRKQALHDMMAGCIVVRDPIPDGPGFWEAASANYNPRQDKIRILWGCALVAVLAGLAGLFESPSSDENWTGYVYPDRDFLLDHRELDSVYPSLAACRRAATRYIDAHGYENASYECGLNCYRRAGYTLDICERTVD